MMNPVSNKSIFVRIKESLIYDNKALLIDKDGCLNQKETYQIYSGAINDISSLIKEGDVCLIAPFLKKETIIIIAAIVSLGGRIIVGDPQDTLENYLASINDKIGRLTDKLNAVESSVYEYLNTRSSSALENFYRFEQEYMDLTEELNDSIVKDETMMLERNIRLMSRDYTAHAEAAERVVLRAVGTQFCRGL